MRSLLPALLLVLLGTPAEIVAQTHGLGAAWGPTSSVAQQRVARSAVATDSTRLGMEREGRLRVAPLFAQSCPARTNAIFTMAVVGALAGGAIGMAYGSAGHPGLPHLGDIPSQWEYTPFFILAGGIVGGVLGGRSARCPRVRERDQ